MLDVEGRPNARAVSVYTESDCWLLAWYLTSEGGLPVVTVGPSDDPDDWHHVMVDLGRETLLDVRGPRSRDETLGYWSKKLEHLSGTEWVLKDHGRFADLDTYLTYMEALRSEVIFEQDQINARTVARALLERHAPERTAET